MPLPGSYRRRAGAEFMGGRRSRVDTVLCGAKEPRDALGQSLMWDTGLYVGPGLYVEPKNDCETKRLPVGLMSH